MSDQNLFEIANRQKYRFQTPRGNVTVEDLWDLSLEELDAVYMAYNAALREADQDSLLKKRDQQNEAGTNKRDIVVFVVRAKQAAAEARATLQERRQKAARIRELLAKKQDAELEAKSADELQGLLAEFEA